MRRWWGTVSKAFWKSKYIISIIFFTIYINDLPDVVQNIANLFSDDTKVYAIVNKKEEQHTMWSNMQSLINLSIVLHTIDVKLIGRSFSTKCVGPFFRIVVTFASFQLSGDFIVSMDILKLAELMNIFSKCLHCRSR
jgi:hypothetical protein